MPVAPIPKNYCHITGIISSKKSIGDAEFVAGLEPDFYRTLAFDPNVRKFEVQPARVYWHDESGKKHRYTPDCRVHFEFRSKPVLFEVKFRSFLRKHWKELRPCYRAAVHYARLEGSIFKFATEREIRTPYLENVKLLLPIVRRGADRAQQERLMFGIATLGETTPALLLQHVCRDQSEWGFLLNVVWYLVGTFQIRADLAVPLTVDSALKPR